MNQSSSTPDASNRENSCANTRATNDSLHSLRVVVMGAGVAGCSAAIHLARRGASVTLIESKPFPRVKVCGEYVSPAATDDLECLLDAAALRSLGARRVDRFGVIVQGASGTRRIEWLTPVSAWALSRGSLDTALLEAADSTGVTRLQPVTVRSVAYADDGVTVTLVDGSHIDTDIVVHADGTGRHDTGAGSSIDRASRPTPAIAGLIGLKCHARLPHDQHHASSVEMRAGNGVYAGSVLVEDGLATIALCAHTDVLRALKGDHDAVLERAWPSWNRAWREGDWLACPVPRSRYIKPSHARSFRVGNAAAAIDPVGGEGIGNALWSGRVLANALAKSLTLSPAQADSKSESVRFTTDHKACLSTAHVTIAHAYARRLRTRLPACQLAAFGLMRPSLMRLIWPLLRFPSLTLRPWYRLTGKPNRQTKSANQ